MALSGRIAVVIVLMLILLLVHSVNVSSQPPDQLQPGFNQALAQVQRAESAGATTNEIAQLVLALNQALQLNRQALQLTNPKDAQNRTQLLNQVDQILETVQTQASQLEITVSQRTSTNTAVAYISGGIAAFLVALAYAYGFSLWRRYRIKRTFQMKVISK